MRRNIENTMMQCGNVQDMPLMRKTAADDGKQAKLAPAGSIVVTCCVTLPDGSVCDVDVSVRQSS